MSALVIAFRGTPKPKRRRSLSRLVLKVQRLEDADPEVAAIVERLVDDLLVDVYEWARLGAVARIRGEQDGA